MTLPVALFHRCCWQFCPFYASCQVTVPAPPWHGNKAAAWFCARHERVWQIALGTGYSWINFTYGRAPRFGWGIVPPG